MTAQTAGRDAHAAVTGIGLVTPVGSTGAEVFDAMCEGRSGLSAPGSDGGRRLLSFAICS